MRLEDEIANARRRHFEQCFKCKSPQPPPNRDSGGMTDIERAAYNRGRADLVGELRGPLLLMAALMVARMVLQVIGNPGAE